MGNLSDNNKIGYRGGNGEDQEERKGYIEDEEAMEDDNELLGDEDDGVADSEEDADGEDLIDGMEAYVSLNSFHFCGILNNHFVVTMRPSLSSIAMKPRVSTTRATTQSWTTRLAETPRDSWIRIVSVSSAGAELAPSCRTMTTSTLRTTRSRDR